MSNVGKRVVAETDDILRFDDGSMVMADRDSGMLENYNPVQTRAWDAYLVDVERYNRLIERFWERHNAAFGDRIRTDENRLPYAVEVGFGGFLQLPDAEPWPEMEADIAWIQAFKRKQQKGFLEWIECGNLTR